MKKNVILTAKFHDQNAAPFVTSVGKHRENVVFKNVAFFGGNQARVNLVMLNFKLEVAFHLKIKTKYQLQNLLECVQSSYQLVGALWVELAWPQEAHEEAIIVVRDVQFFVI